MIAIGFRPLAAPTARDAPRRPSARATSPYEQVRPKGIASNPSHTARWNAVPARRSSGTANSRRVPAKYAASCPAAAATMRAASPPRPPPPGSCAGPGAAPRGPRNSQRHRPASVAASATAPSGVRITRLAFECAMVPRPSPRAPRPRRLPHRPERHGAGHSIPPAA